MDSQVRSDIPEASLDQVDLALREGRQVLDVRETAEYVTGHIPGARLLPMGQVADRLGELDRSSSLLVVCTSGNRSAATTHVLRGAGYDAYSVAGGTSAWQASGRPVVCGLQER